MLNTRKQEITYEVYDEQGRSVGCVVLPTSRRVVGRDQPTVLLRRPSPGRPTSRPAAEARRTA